MAITVHFLILSILAVHLSPTAAAPPKITAVFGFGDSILDAGNNNRIPTFGRSSHRPYGMSFPDKIPTGRFSDGKVPTDMVASKLGIKPLVPAYLDPATTDKDLLTGVTFASGGSGLDDLTWKMCVALSMEKQLELFEEALGRMRRNAGEEEVTAVVEKALFTISAANNDVMITKCILGLRKSFTVTQYHDFLLGRMEAFIRNSVLGEIIVQCLPDPRVIILVPNENEGLHNMGARKAAVLGLPPVGCIPMIMIMDNLKNFGSLSNLTCIDKYNMESQAHNVKLQALLSHLSTSLPATKLVYVDIYSIVLPMINNPTAYGFENSNKSCCGDGILALAVLCNKFVPLCPNPSKYLFWDSAHPTQTTYTIVVEHFIKNDLPKLL